jgi:hypothetical protein
MITVAINKIDKSTAAQLVLINQKKQEALAKLEIQYQTTKQVKGPLTFIVIIVICLLAILVIFLDSFRLFKYLKVKLLKERHRCRQIDVASNKMSNQINRITNESDLIQNYNDLEYNLYKSFLIAKHKRSLR